MQTHCDARARGRHAGTAMLVRVAPGDDTRFVNAAMSHGARKHKVEAGEEEVEREGQEEEAIGRGEEVLSVSTVRPTLHSNHTLPWYACDCCSRLLLANPSRHPLKLKSSWHRASAECPAWWKKQQRMPRRQRHTAWISRCRLLVELGGKKNITKGRQRASIQPSQSDCAAATHGRPLAPRSDRMNE